MNQQIVIVTRVGCLMNTLPTEDQVRWWGKMASSIAARVLTRVDTPHTWVWKTHHSHLALVRSLAPPNVFVIDQDDLTSPDIPGEHFLTVRLDADDAYLPSIFPTLAKLNLPLEHALSLPCGYQIDFISGSGYMLDYRKHWAPPFLVLSNPREKMFHIAVHSEVRNEYQVRESAEPSWVQMVGDWNAVNTPDKFGDGNRWPVHMILKEIGLEREDLALHGPLDKLAAKHGTDKGTAPGIGLFPKRYTLPYAQLLERWKNKPVRLLELGVSRGASLRMWADYLPKARIAGIDLKTRPAGLSDRCMVFKGDQTSHATLAQAIDWLGGVDIVIDDAGHKTHLHQASYDYLWPRLEKGGWLGIEDLHASPASIDWLKGLNATFYSNNRLAILHK